MNKIGVDTILDTGVRGQVVSVLELRPEIIFVAQQRERGQNWCSGVDMPGHFFD